MAMKKLDCKKMLKKAVLLAAALMPLSAYCGDTVGTITVISSVAGVPGYENWAFITMTGTNTALPACSTAGNMYVLDLTTNAGKAAYATILAAKMTNSSIRVEGTGTCSVHAASETVRVIRLL